MLLHRSALTLFTVINTVGFAAAAQSPAPTGSVVPSAHPSVSSNPCTTSRCLQKKGKSGKEKKGKSSKGKGSSSSIDSTQPVADLTQPVATADPESDYRNVVDAVTTPNLSTTMGTPESNSASSVAPVAKTAIFLMVATAVFLM